MESDTIKDLDDVHQCPGDFGEGRVVRQRREGRLFRFLPPGLLLAKPCWREGMGRAACILLCFCSTTLPKTHQSSEDQRANKCWMGWLRAQGRRRGMCQGFLSYMSLTFTPVTPSPVLMLSQHPSIRSLSWDTWYLKIGLPCVSHAACPAQ